MPPARTSLRHPLALAAALLPLLAGCLPGSQRETTTALLPADSLSRTFTATVPTDSLALAWASSEAPLEFPTSLAWVGGDGIAEGRLVVADTKGGALHVFTADGRYDGEVRPAEPALVYPYLTGARGDTAVVFSRGAGRLDWVDLDARRVVRSVPIAEETPAGEREANAATAVATADGGAWVKRAAENEPAALVRLDRRGREVARLDLPGPSWRRFGFLRVAGDTLVSLSGYRPVVDVLRPGSSSLDTLALHGFDSPQLLRSHQYVRGEVDQPPLLSPSAVWFDGRWFVLNLRTTALRVDVYGPDGRLQRVLERPLPDAARSQFPVDLAVRGDSAGYALAVVMQRPGGILSSSGGAVWMLRWTPSAPAATPATDSTVAPGYSEEGA